MRNPFRRRPRTSEISGNGEVGAMASPQEFDNSGRPIIDFSPEDRRLIRLSGHGYSPETIYRTQPAVRICVNFLAVQLSHLKLKVYRRRDNDAPEYLRDHPLATLLDKPNGRTTGTDLIHGTVADKAIYDTAYWLKSRVGNSRALFRIPPAFVQPKGGSILSGPALYTIDVGTGPLDFDPSQIIDFSGYNALDTRFGTSPLDALRSILEEEVASSLHRRNYWKKAARIEGVIERPSAAPDWSDEARKRFRRDWSNVTAGESNAGETGILEDDMKWVQAGFSPKDSEFIAGREFALDLTATLYNIPLAMLSRKQTSTYASTKEYHQILYVDTLGPWAAAIEATVGLFLVPDFDDPALYTEFNIEEKLQGDFETQADAIRSAVQVPWMSVNRALLIRNMEPIGDPQDPTNPFNFPARPSNYSYEGEAAQPDPGLRIAPAALAETAGAPHGIDEELVAILEEQAR